tara:strand:- start:146 stop:418 length:273 start_codon:yes stop_codon:yes gene_type:complete
VKFLVFFSIDWSEGDRQAVPLASFDTQREAEIYSFGYIDAICNHTGSDKEEVDRNQVASMIRIEKLKLTKQQQKEYDRMYKDQKGDKDNE